MIIRKRRLGDVGALANVRFAPEAAVPYATDGYLDKGGNVQRMVHLRRRVARTWAGGVVCPYCGHDKAYELSRKNIYRGAQCTNFSVTVGTIFEDTKLPLRIWFGAIWLITKHPKGIASTTLARDLGITQKSAWFVLHRLRHAARTAAGAVRR